MLLFLICEFFGFVNEWGFIASNDEQGTLNFLGSPPLIPYKTLFYFAPNANVVLTY